MPQHFEYAACEFPFALDRLIGVGVRAHRDRARRVVRSRQFFAEQFRRVRLHEQLRLEIEARRHAVIGVRRPREAIDAAVLAAAIGIDRAVETEIGGFVPRDDLSRALFALDGLESRQVVERLPAIVERNARAGLVAPARIGNRAAPAAAFVSDRRRKQPVRAFGREVGFVAINVEFAFGLESVFHGLHSQWKEILVLK
jgi:hypothetical protein